MHDSFGCSRRLWLQLEECVSEEDLSVSVLDRKGANVEKRSTHLRIMSQSPSVRKVARFVTGGFFEKMSLEESEKLLNVATKLLS